jgi:citrate lyase subunit beta/citryl-CoA lyase
MNYRRRSVLITTCADASLMEKQRRAACDVALLELEDGVPVDRKDEARKRAVDALSSWDYLGKERWVRVNSVNSLDGMRDILALVAPRADGLVLGKLREPEEVAVADYLLERREEELGIPPHTKLLPMVESGPALIQLPAIIRASPRVIGVVLGTEDLSADVGYVRTEEEFEISYARSHVVSVAHSLGVQCFDVASVKLREPEALYALARRSYHFGFDGKVAISPSQVPAIEKAFTPSEEEVGWAHRIVAAEAQAQKDGVAVYAVDGRMVDAPFIKMARRVIARAGDQG